MESKLSTHTYIYMCVCIIKEQIEGEREKRPKDKRLLWKRIEMFLIWKGVNSLVAFQGMPERELLAIASRSGS